MSDSLDFRVLHALRCIGFSGEDRVGRAAGLGTSVTVDALRRLTDQGEVESAHGPFGGWGITEAGRVRDRKLVADELARTGASDQVRRRYESFLDLNPVLLQVCSDWQMTTVGGSPVVNDHSDAGYDAKVLGRLMKIDDAVQPVCGDLATSLERFSPYAGRLSSALERAMAGETAYVADDFDSYHMVWAQLHEDLLQTLSISREDERGDG